jgi:hypothetical protein
MVVRIGGKRMFMWRAVDREGEVLDVLVQKRRNKAAALKLLRKLLKHQGYVPNEFVTDGLASYKAAMTILGCQQRHKPGRLRDNSRVENSHLPVRRRERKMQRFKSQGQAQRFVSTYGAIYNSFNIERHLISRSTMKRFRASAMEEWLAASADRQYSRTPPALRSGGNRHISYCGSGPHCGQDRRTKAGQRKYAIDVDSSPHMHGAPLRIRAPKPLFSCGL